MNKYRKDMCTCVNGVLCKSCIAWGGKLAKGGYAKSISGYSDKLAQLLEKLPLEQQRLEDLIAQNVTHHVVGFHKVIKQQRQKVNGLVISISKLEEKITILQQNL